MEVEGENLESTSPNQNEKPESKRKRGRPSNATANENSTAPKKTFPNIPKNPNKVENPNEPIYLPRTTIVKIVKRQVLTVLF